MRRLPNIPKLLEEVRSDFIRDDIGLLSARAHERTITHRVALYLQIRLPSWKVDCEYNRQGLGTDPKKDDKKRKRYPDVIVHERGDKGINLLVLEAKANWASKKSIDLDRDKLRSMVTKFNYHFAYLLTYSAGRSADLYFEPVK